MKTSTIRKQSFGVWILTSLLMMINASSTSGTFFKKLEEDSKDEMDSSVILSLFMTDFQQCSLANNCNYIAVSTNDKKTYQAARRDKLEGIGMKFQVWEKVKDLSQEKKQRRSNKKKKFFIRHWGGLCVSRRASDNILVLNSSCADTFTLTSMKALKHSRSGKCVAPRNNNQDAVIGLTSNCDDINTRFEQTASLLMKHVSTGYCVHPQGGSQNPEIGTQVVIHSHCSCHPRIQFELIYAFNSCKDAMDKGRRENGIEHLQWTNGSMLPVYCDMQTDKGGWIVFQKRQNSSVSFERNWKDYERGFGDLQGNFWLGLEALQFLTSAGNWTLRIDLKAADGDQGYAKYTNFKIGRKEEKYRITYDQYSGTIGDAMQHSKGSPFSTYDNENDRKADIHCASYFKGGWWHSDCFYGMLNNLYPGMGTSQTHPLKADFMTWKTWKNSFGNIVFSEMKMKNEN